jgi:hypothetical protein
MNNRAPIKKNQQNQQHSLPKINGAINNKKNNCPFKSTRSLSVNDSRALTNSNKLSSLPSVLNKPTTHLQQMRMRSKTEILCSRTTSKGFAGCTGKRMSFSQGNRRWSTISEESACLTRLKLSLKVPSSPQFKQVLKDIEN